MAGEEVNQMSHLDDDEINLGDLVRRLWGGKVWIAGTTGVAALVGLFIAAGTPPTYRADALLQLEEKRGQLALPSALSDLAGSEPRSETEIEIIRSRLVLGQAVADAHLDWYAVPRKLPTVLSALAKFGFPLPDVGGLSAFARGDEKLRVDLLEVPAEWIGQSIRLVSNGATGFTVFLPNGAEVEGRVGVPLIDAGRGFALRIGELDAPEAREFDIVHLSETSAISSLRGRLSVTERGRYTGVLELGFTGENPDETERTLHAISQAYLKQNVSRSAAEAESSLAFIESQLPEAEQTLRKAEASLNQYRQAQQAIDLGFEGQSLLTQITNLESELQKLADEEDTLAERYTPNHPTYQQLLSAKSRLQERLERLRSEVGSLPQTQRVVFNLTRDLELAQAGYVELLNRAQELRVMKASTIGNVRIVDQARTAPYPIAPRSARIVALSVLLGLLSGAGLVLLRHMLRRGIQSAKDLEAMGLPVFATINYLPEAAQHRKRQGSLPIYALSKPDDVVIEGFRSLRTSLHFGLIDASTRSLAITSSAPEAGKSFVVTNLGVVAAQAGQRVCIVDADLRRGYLRRYFSVPKVHRGLSEYLAGEVDLEDIVVPGPIPGLYFIPPGQFPPNPSELLMRDRLTDLVNALDQSFDLALFDTPPVLAVTDPMIISRAVGGTILVARYDVTPLGEIEAVQRQFLNSGLRLAGSVLNGFDPRRASESSGYGYGYSYRYAYKRED
ncbi:polysaccharide biosynthesis tyrosine autokinase [Sedimentimonas flavescens]|uniref:Polysaccharide biosynthesis tyrosine autokinase n=1 Tax=Sedimentimonas flavescens TaxID=2851012 RepID=A0ABT2ZVL3_9RHOB|nr:polysaccharide biosynthesis tyrosine autokinase [Sedimentimonas flavescens]MCV2877686.1 polysaccharide biosynthesis tyrosine autokinase [Sedimentimonas flavescens]